MTIILHRIWLSQIIIPLTRPIDKLQYTEEWDVTVKLINKTKLKINKKNLNTMKEDIKLIRTMTNDKDYGTMVDRSSKDIH